MTLPSTPTIVPEPHPKEDQHFLIDEMVLKFILKTAQLKKEEEILEIGAGSGNLTKLLAPKVKKVLAVEKDFRFLPELEKIENVEVLGMDVHNLFFQRKYFAKIVANIPYQICEPLMRYLCYSSYTNNLQLAVLLLPKPFAEKAKEHPVFSAFLEIELLLEVPRSAFQPQPHVTSAVVKITPRKELNENLFLRRKLFLQEDKKVKNALRDTLIDFSDYLKKAKLTKKKALDLIDKMFLSDDFLDAKMNELKNKEFNVLVQKIEELKL